MFKTIACVLALAAAVPAAAESLVVRYDDLNLSSAAGMKVLDRRIDGAARQVCGANQDYRQGLAEKAAAQKCVAGARAGAADQIARLEVGTARGG